MAFDNFLSDAIFFVKNLCAVTNRIFFPEVKFLFAKKNIRDITRTAVTDKAKFEFVAAFIYLERIPFPQNKFFSRAQCALGCKFYYQTRCPGLSFKTFGFERLRRPYHRG